MKIRNFVVACALSITSSFAMDQAPDSQSVSRVYSNAASMLKNVLRSYESPLPAEPRISAEECATFFRTQEPAVQGRLLGVLVHYIGEHTQPGYSRSIAGDCEEYIAEVIRDCGMAPESMHTENTAPRVSNLFEQVQQQPQWSEAVPFAQELSRLCTNYVQSLDPASDARGQIEHAAQDRNARMAKVGALLESAGNRRRRLAERLTPQERERIDRMVRGDEEPGAPKEPKNS